MGALFERHDPPADEREIRSLSDRSGVELGQVRALFQQESARLGMGANIGSYLAVLTTASMRAVLRRAAQHRKLPGHLYRDSRNVPATMWPDRFISGT